MSDQSPTTLHRRPRERLTHILFATALAGFVAVMFQVVRHAVASGTRPEEGQRAAAPVTSGPEILAVFIGNSSCRGVRLPGFNDTYRTTMDALAAMAASQGAHFTRVGVSTDNSPRIGQAFLNQFGPFDEVIVGHGMLNSGAVHFMWRDLPGNPMLPQVVIVRREVRVTDAGVVVAADSILGRLQGLQGMRAWLDQASATEGRRARSM